MGATGMKHPERRQAGGRAFRGSVPIAVAAAAALTMAPVPPSVSGQGPTYELVTQQRWLHGSQRAEFVPFTTTTHWIRVDSAAPSILGGRVLYVALGRTPHDLVSVGRIETGRRGDTGMTSLRVRELAGAAESGPWSRPAPAIGRYVVDGVLALPETRLWDLVPAVPPELRIGTRWGDTVHASVDRGGASQRYTAERESVIVGDTMTAAGRLWIIEDSASVDWSERFPELERSLDTLVVLERRAVGTVRGRHLYDAEAGLFRRRSDSTALDGAVLLVYPDGREYRSAAKFERKRRWVAHDPVSLERRTRELAVEREQSRGSPSRASIVGDPAAAGDTAAIVAAIADAFSRRPVSLPELRLLIRFQENPGLALAFGLSRDRLYTSPAGALQRRPPATTTDTAAWPCAPEACRALARQWEDASEPRLRDLGLSAHYLMDPVRWGRVISARAAEGSWLARWTLALMEGRTDSRSGPLPPRGSPWRAWQKWLGPGRLPSDRHATALRFLGTRTGRDPIPELRRGFERAESDSALLVFESLLLALREYRPTAGIVAAHITSASDALRTLGRIELVALRRSAAPADAGTAAELADRVLGIAFDGEPEWQSIPGAGSATPRPDPVGDGALLLVENLPAATGARWARRVPAVTAPEWMRLPAAPGAVLVSLLPVRVADPFAFVGYAVDRTESREPGRRVIEWASGHEWVLLRTTAGWVVVSHGAWTK
ncbi:MAG: hypothetical protein PVH00_13460 [Gemmatimonadota bacterium]